MNRTGEQNDLHTINNNINSINTNINNMYSMLNIISNSILLNQLQNIRPPPPPPPIVRPRFNPMTSSLFSHINNTTPSSLFSHLNNTTPSSFTPPTPLFTPPTPLFTPSTDTPLGAGARSTEQSPPNTTPLNNTTATEQTPITSTNREIFTNIFSNILRNEMTPGMGNMGISVMGFSPPDPVNETLVISHHNIYNNTKIKLHVNEEGEEAPQCTICLDNIQQNNIIREINKCKHTFHIECSDKWFEDHITCPHCRQDIRIEIVD
jgi:hypothetical protein